MMMNNRSELYRYTIFTYFPTFQKKKPRGIKKAENVQRTKNGEFIVFVAFPVIIDRHANTN